MIDVKIVDIQPAFNKSTFNFLVLQTGEKVFSKFFFPKNDSEKMEQIERWLRSISRSYYKPETILLAIIQALVTGILGLAFANALKPDMTASEMIASINLILAYVICYVVMLFKITSISPIKLLNTFQKLRYENLISYHVEPYLCQIIVQKNDRVIERQVGYAGITDDGKVVSLSQELTLIDPIILDQNAMKEKISYAYKRKFGERQSVEVILKL